ncbi:MAG: outer membrane beta-barrel protein [Candidatus Zixiibacteriota bacterium]|nr:MAG: outer membrane beta-barrel protein [candidate division Zixibacteria bacterium]
MYSNSLLKIAMIIAIVNLVSPMARGGKFEEENIEKKYGLVITGSWNSLKNEKLNEEYIVEWTAGSDKINSGYGFSADLRYYISSKISVSGGVLYMNGSSIYDRIIDPVFGSDTITEDYVKTRILAPSFCLRYHIYLERVDFSLGVSEFLLFGKASRHHTLDITLGEFFVLENEYYSTGIGIQLYGGLQYKLNGFASYIMEAGYRHFKTGDLIEKETDVAFRSSLGRSGEPINLDYSGPYISAGLMFGLF